MLNHERERRAQKQLLATVAEREQGKPKKGIINTAIIVSIFWLSAFGGYWLANRETTVATIHQRGPTEVETAICERIGRPALYATITVDKLENVAWEWQEKGQTLKKFCVRRAVR